MGKFYDAEKTNEYFEQMDGAIATYAEQANAVLSSFATFAGDDEQKGEQAEAVKELVGTGEKNLVDRMIDIQQQISEAGEHIRESFETGVDAAPDALIEEDTLLQIEDSFKGFYKTYDDLGTQIEDIATILQSKFGEYATFERPDFECGREAFKNFCGGATAGGFLQECLKKLQDFDATEAAHLSGLGLEEQLDGLNNRVKNTSAVFASLDMSKPDVSRVNLNRLEAEAMKREIEAVGRKIKNETDSENVFDINPNEINVSGIPVEVSHWDVDPSLFEPKERAKLDASTDYYAQMSPAQQRMALKLYEDYVATEGKIADEKSANDIAHLMERHFRVTGDSAREAEAVKLQTRTAGMATAAAAGAVDVLVKPLDAVYAAESALFGARDLDESGKTTTVRERFVNAWKGAQAQHDFSDIQAQHPVAYTGGKIAGNVILYKGATQSLGSISKVSEATTKAGNAIASKAGSVLSGNAGEIVKNAGNAIGNVIQGTIPDILLDTIPTEIANVSDGMSAGEVAWDTVKNVSGNVAFNVIGEAAPAVLKAIGGGDAAKNTAQSMPVSMDAAAQQASKSDAFDLDNKTLQIGDDALGANRKAVDNLITDGSHLEGGKLKSNVTYQTGEHNYIYKTNDEGLIVSVHADDLQLKAHDGRLRHNPNTYGKEAGDHAGHLIGDRFGGSADLDNLVSQARRVNLSEYRKIENQWEKAIHEGKKVTVDIKINYDIGGVRPASFKVLYTIDGDLFVKNIRN